MRRTSFASEILNQISSFMAVGTKKGKRRFFSSCISPVAAACFLSSCHEKGPPATELSKLSDYFFSPPPFLDGLLFLCELYPGKRRRGGSVSVDTIPANKRRGGKEKKSITTTTTTVLYSLGRRKEGHVHCAVLPHCSSSSYFPHSTTKLPVYM